MKFVKLKELANIELSNVDKKIKDDELSVTLCNFVDVYRNWAITNNISKLFMKATATKNEIKKFTLKKGYVAITKDSETRDDIGIPTYIADDLENTILGYHCVLIKPENDKLNGKYLNAILNSKMAKKYFANNASGSGQRYTLTVDIIGNFPIPLIDINEQKRIGNIFSNIDNKIELNNKINDELESMAKTIYDYWFLQFEFPNEEGKPYKSSGGKMVWNEELKREIPEGWEVKTLYDIADYINGLACQKYRPINKDNILPVIKIVEMHNGITSNTEYVRDDIPLKNIIDTGDILFSWSASLEVTLWKGKKAGLNQHIFKVVPKFYPKYYIYMQLSAYIINFIKIAETRKTTMGHITIDHLKQSKILLSNIKLAKTYDIFVKDLFEKILLNNIENQELTSLRDFLLPLLMNGQVGFKGDKAEG